MAGGGDGGGSIRFPSAWCGTFGLKPSRGRNPMGLILVKAGRGPWLTM
ncbi:amidase family protein [Psychrobacter sp. JCM 18901]